MRLLNRSLWVKLVIAFLVVAVVGVTVVSLLANQATSVGLRRFLDAESGEEWASLQSMLAGYYAREGSWAGVEGLLADVQPGRGQGSLGLSLLDETGQMAASAGGQRNRPENEAAADLSLPITVDGRQVGQLLIRAPGAGVSRAGEQFLAEVNRAILWGGLAAVLLALFLGIFLAHRLTQPLRRLTRASQAMATGELGQQVPVSGEDEIGELAASFNQMSAALENAERQRQQLLADVAHELRTPLSIMRGHMEAMMDGVFELSSENLAVAHEETVLIGRLVEDLRTLSLAEAGQLPLNRAPVDVGALVGQAAAAFAPLAEADGVRLAAEIAPDLPLAAADRDRIQQVLANLLSNALRHAGKASTQAWVQLGVSQQEGEIRVSVADSGPGLSPEARQHVFDRFWRADTARARDQGGSGLGLAICRAIVTAHQGRIWVQGQPGQGTVFVFTLPLAGP